MPRFAFPGTRRRHRSPASPIVRAPEFVEAGVRVRATGSTAVELAGDARFDRDSTARIDVVASWSEWADAGPRTGPPIHRSIERRVIDVIPGARIDPVRSNGILPVRVSHELGDTRRREVRYSLVASARTSDPFEVDLPATSPPPPPVVSTVVPGLAGDTVCLHLERPWYESGEGELVGILVASSRTGGSDGSPDVTRWDDSATVARLKDFPARVASRTGVRIDGTASVVDVAGHEVRYDAPTDRWRSDIVVAGRNSLRSRPLRLVVVRFQPHAVEGAHLSVAVALPAVLVGGSATSATPSTTTSPTTVTVQRPG